MQNGKLIFDMEKSLTAAFFEHIFSATQTGKHLDTCTRFL